MLDTHMIKISKKISGTLLMITSLIISGCHTYETCSYSSSLLDPINNSATISVKEFSKAPVTMGKIYLFQHYLFVNSPNRGIYIYDNSDSTNPQPLIFIDVPGNVDMAIKQGYLYADSYDDLVTIKLVDEFGNVLINTDNVSEVSRVENVFPIYRQDSPIMIDGSC